MTIQRLPDLRYALEKVTGFRALVEEFVERPEEVREGKGPILRCVGKQAKKRSWKLTEGAYATAVCLEDVLRLAVEELGKKGGRKLTPRRGIEELLSAQVETLRVLERLEKAMTPLVRNPMVSSALCNRAIDFITERNKNSSPAEVALALIYMLQSFLELMDNQCQEIKCSSCSDPCLPERRRRRRGLD